MTWRSAHAPDLKIRPLPRESAGARAAFRAFRDSRPAPAVRAAVVSGLLTLLVHTLLLAQSVALSGQASGWVASKPDTAVISQIGLRYIPELAVQQPLGNGVAAQLDVSTNGYTSGGYGSGAAPQYASGLEVYRAWLRIATNTFETRIGLQRINFGSATLFRPLMWFDRVDPRDPLQLTDGVKALLARYSFQNNANVWGWALYGNSQPTGWETVPTADKTVEYGGRIQTPVPAGEVGLTYHHRQADLDVPLGAVVPEDRFGFDGKWNLGIGLWVEGALVHEGTDSVALRYQRFWTVGADYTVGVGSGLYLLMEYCQIETPPTPFGSAPGTGFSGLSMNYPIGILDRVSAIVYHNWQLDQWYRILTWQRSYDTWTFYLLAFWNPQVLEGLEPELQSQMFAGRGLELEAVFNH
jgi:hypothetical protein